MARFKKGNQAAKGKGRPKGSINKLSEFKNDLIEAYELNGGLEWLTTWAKENPSKFIDIISRLLPRDINVQQSGEIKVTHESASISRVNEWIGQIAEGGIGQDNEDSSTERSLLPN